MNAFTCNCIVYAVQARLLSYRMMLRRVMFTLYTRSSVVTINLCVIIVVDVDTLLKYTVAF